jgi:hypothetical protein
MPIECEYIVVHDDTVHIIDLSKVVGWGNHTLILLKP